MNPLAALKQGIVDHVRSAAFITLGELRAVFHRDARAQEFTEAYNDLMRIKQLTTVQQSDGTTQVLPYVQKKNIEDLMFRSDEHTYELQSLMRLSYAVFCSNSKQNKNTQTRDME